jgi:hypothetical protein
MQTEDHIVKVTEMAENTIELLCLLSTWGQTFKSSTTLRIK